MARISADIHIDATPREVWEASTDLGRIGSWVSIHRGFPGTPPTDLSAGSRFGQTLKIAGTRFQVEWTATEVEPPTKLVWDGTGPAGSSAHTSYALEPEGDGTCFTYRNEFTLPAGKLGKAAGRMVERQAERQLRKSLEMLKALVEE